MDDPGLVLPYTTDRQSKIDPTEFAAFPFYAAHFGTGGLPDWVVKALKLPLFNDRIGDTTILADGQLSGRP